MTEHSETLDKIKKFVLGSAQFGLDYGISNKLGQVPYSEVKKILAKASKVGISSIDTAAAYGESEKIIGKVCQELLLPLNIITKFPVCTKSTMKDAFHESLIKLKAEKVHAYLLHSFSIYKHNPNIVNELKELKHKGKVEKIGISVYHPHELKELLDKEIEIDIIQLPYNVFDQRFDQLLPKLSGLKIESHIRSVYLQGLFFLNSEELPTNFQSIAGKIESLRKLAEEEKVPLGAILLNFVLANPFISKVVVGVQSLHNLSENISFLDYKISEKAIVLMKKMKESDERIILPYNW